MSPLALALTPGSPVVLWLGEIVVLCSVVGAIWKFGMKHRWDSFRDDLKAAGQSLDEVHRATTVNGHRDPRNPTLRDDMADIKEHLKRQDTDLAELRKGQTADQALLAGHLGWSEAEVSRLWKAIAKKADR